MHSYDDDDDKRSGLFIVGMWGERLEDDFTNELC